MEMKVDKEEEEEEMEVPREGNREFLLSLAPLIENLSEVDSMRLKQEVLCMVEAIGQSDRERQVLSFVSSCPVLWEVGHPSFGNKEEEETAWAQISLDTSIPVDECKNIWADLTKDFTKHLELPEPREKWKYEEEMEFCIPYITLARPPLVEVKREEALEISVERVESLNDGSMEDDEDETSPLELCQVECPSSPGVAPTQQQPQPDTTLFEFFMNMARTTASFPPRLQAHVKSEVFRAVNSAEIELHSHLLQMDLQLQAGITQQRASGGRWRTPK